MYILFLYIYLFFLCIFSLGEMWPGHFFFFLVLCTLCAGTRLTRTVSRSSCETESPSQTIELMRSTICMCTFWLCPLLKKKKKMVNTRTDLKSGASGSQSRGVEDGKQTQWGRENRNTSKFFHLHMRAERCSVPHRGHFRLSEHHWLRWITPICSLYSAHAMKGFHLGFARIIVIWPNAGK